MNVQVLCAAADTVGLCLFGRTVTNINLDMIMAAVNNAVGAELPVSFYTQIGIETLMLEEKFNRDAGFDVDDDELPSFFYEESLAPTNKRARHRAKEVGEYRAAWLANASAEHGIDGTGVDRLY